MALRMALRMALLMALLMALRMALRMASRRQLSRLAPMRSLQHAIVTWHEPPRFQRQDVDRQPFKRQHVKQQHGERQHVKRDLCIFTKVNKTRVPATDLHHILHEQS